MLIWVSYWCGASAIFFLDWGPNYLCGPTNFVEATQSFCQLVVYTVNLFSNTMPMLSKWNLYFYDTNTFFVKYVQSSN